VFRSCSEILPHRLPQPEGAANARANPTMGQEVFFCALYGDLYAQSLFPLRAPRPYLGFSRSPFPKLFRPVDSPRSSLERSRRAVSPSSGESFEFRPALDFPLPHIPLSVPRFSDLNALLCPERNFYRCTDGCGPSPMQWGELRVILLPTKTEVKDWAKSNKAPSSPVTRTKELPPQSFPPL